MSSSAFRGAGSVFLQPIINSFVQDASASQASGSHPLEQHPWALSIALLLCSSIWSVFLEVDASSNFLQARSSRHDVFLASLVRPPSPAILFHPQLPPQPVATAAHNRPAHDSHAHTPHTSSAHLPSTPAAPAIPATQLHQLDTHACAAVARSHLPPRLAPGQARPLALAASKATR